MRDQLRSTSDKLAKLVSYCQIWCIGLIESGGFPADFSLVDPIDKVDTVDHIGELLEAA